MKTYCLVLIITLFFLTSGCDASDITGTVVDAKTGKPIEGAVVLVEWTKTKGIGFTSTESYRVVEVFTDKEGKFTVASVSAFFVTPHLTIYKKGYVAWNDEHLFPDYKKRTDFKWKNEYMFKLDPFSATYSYIEHQSFIHRAIRVSLAPNTKHFFLKKYDEGELQKVIEEEAKLKEGNQK